MRELKNSIKNIKNINDTIERREKANIKYLIKEYSFENRLKKIQQKFDSIDTSKKSCNYYLNQQKYSLKILEENLKNVEKMTNQIIKPIDYINGFIPKDSVYNDIQKSIKKVNWIEICKSLSQRIDLNYPFIYLFIQSDEFSEILWKHVEEINDKELKEVFSLRFLKTITKDWWIFPRFKLEEYKKISKNEDIDSFNNFVLDKFYFNPELLERVIKDWNIKNENRRIIIEQAYFNYLHGNYETCVIILILQIEGMMKEKIDYYKKDSDLRIEIENSLNQNSNTGDAWESFLNKANAEFILRILKPLYDKVNFEYHMGDIKRHEIAHVGIVETSQIGAMRLFLILDTVIYILDNLDET